MKDTRELPKYILIKDAIKKRIQQGQFSDKLPGERVLAKDFGFSYMTVRKAIDELVEEDILYRQPARGTFVNKGGVSGKKTYNIGFFLEPRIKGGISSPYYSMLFKKLENILKDEGYTLFFFTDLEDYHPLEKGKKYDGLIMSNFPAIEKKVIDVSEMAPVVIIDNAIEDSSIPYVGIDNYHGVFDAVEYLIKAGHRKIAFISGILDSPVGYNRFHGYQHALEKNGIPFRKQLVREGDYSFNSGQEASRKLLTSKEKPTAIVCANDSMAFGVIETARRLGIGIPDDLSVVGFDDIEFAAQSSPALTTVRAPIEGIARTAVSILLTCLREGTMNTEKILLPAQIVVRDTCRAL